MRSFAVANLTCIFFISKIERHHWWPVHLRHQLPPLLRHWLRWIVDWHDLCLLWSIRLLPQQSFLYLSEERRSSSYWNVHSGQHDDLQGHALLLPAVPFVFQQHVRTLWLLDSWRWLLWKPFRGMHRHHQPEHPLFDQIWCHFEGCRVRNPRSSEVHSIYRAKVHVIPFCCCLFFHTYLFMMRSFAWFNSMCTLTRSISSTVSLIRGKDHVFHSIRFFALFFFCSCHWGSSTRKYATVNVPFKDVVS